MTLQSDMNDRDEILQAPAKRWPRVTFFEGMRLLTDKGASWTVDRVRNDVVGVGTGIGFTQWHRDDLLKCIADGDITIEPMVGMRIQDLQRGSGTVWRVGQTTIHVGGDHDISGIFPYEDFDRLVRSGEWVIRPPKQIERPAPVDCDHNDGDADEVISSHGRTRFMRAPDGGFYIEPQIRGQVGADVLGMLINLTRDRDEAIRRTESAEAEAHDQRSRAEKAEAELSKAEAGRDCALLRDEASSDALRQALDGRSEAEQRADALSIANSRLSARFEKKNAELIATQDKLRRAEASVAEREAAPKPNDAALIAALEQVDRLHAARIADAADVERAQLLAIRGVRALSNDALLDECLRRGFADIRGAR